MRIISMVRVSREALSCSSRSRRMGRPDGVVGMCGVRLRDHRRRKGIIRGQIMTSEGNGIHN